MGKQEFEPLRHLLIDFYNLTGIKACIYDLDGNELCYYPTRLCHFCELLRQDSEMNARCLECDREAFHQCRTTASQYVYTCHAGLSECISPIFYEKRVVGFIMIGQIRPSTPLDFSLIKSSLLESLIPALLKGYDALPRISEDKLHSAFRILDACAGYELLKILMKNDLRPIDTALEEYIEEHIAAPFTVAQLASHFHLAHGELYRIFKDYFSSTPAEYIKKRRLSHATKLLRTTSLPVREIAIHCGIADYNYFSKVFRSELGTTPTAYRKAHSSPCF